MIGILSPIEIESILMSNRVGRLAMCSGNRPYVVPVSYRYDGLSIYCFSGPGQKITIMRSQPNVSLLVDEIQTETSWKSVLVEGVFQELLDPGDQKHAFSTLSTNGASILLQGLVPESGLILYRVLPMVKSGRFESSA